jgi:hypothetical protein
MLARLASAPDGPTIIAADSMEEALAFLSQLLSESGGPELASYRDRVLVFDKPGVLPRLLQGAQIFIPVALDREVAGSLRTNEPRTAFLCAWLLSPVVSSATIAGSTDRRNQKCKQETANV